MVFDPILVRHCGRSFPLALKKWQVGSLHKYIKGTRRRSYGLSAVDGGEDFGERGERLGLGHLRYEPQRSLSPVSIFPPLQCPPLTPPEYVSFLKPFSHEWSP